MWWVHEQEHVKENVLWAIHPSINRKSSEDHTTKLHHVDISGGALGIMRIESLQKHETTIDCAVPGRHDQRSKICQF